MLQSTAFLSAPAFVRFIDASVAFDYFRERERDDEKEKETRI